MGITLDPNKRTRPLEPQTSIARTEKPSTPSTGTGFVAQDNFVATPLTTSADAAEHREIAERDSGGGGDAGTGVTPPEVPVGFVPATTSDPSLNSPPAKLENTGERLDDGNYDLLKHGAYLGKGDGLGFRLRDPELSGADKLQLIDELINDPQGGHIFTSFTQEPRNVAYDNMQAVASGVADAYEAGVVTDEELHGFMEEIGPEAANYFMATLTSDPENTEAGGVVEAAAAQAEALGYEQAAALGYSSSQALIDAHLTTPEAKEDAFNQVLDFVETTNEYNQGFPRADNVGQMSLAVGNLARLSTDGVGFDEQEFADFLNGFEPGYGMGDSASFANEVLARMRVVPGDVEPGGPVELLGKASTLLATSADEEERAQWDVNAQIAFTSSDALIEANLTDETMRKHALDVLATQANALHEEGREAAEGDPPYNLLELPAVVDGATRLMARHGEELIDGFLNATNKPEGAAQLTRFLENTMFSAYATPEQRGRVEDVINKYVDQAIAGVDNDGVDVGQDVGNLLAIVQRAGQEAVARAGEVEAESSIIGDVLESVFTKLASTLATSAVTAITGGNVLAGGLAGTATGTFLSSLLGKEPDPETLRQDLEDAFKKMIEEGGGSVNAGEIILRQLAEVYASVKKDLNENMDALDAQLANSDLSTGQRQMLQNQRNALQEEMTDLDDTYLAIQDTYSITLDSAELDEALDALED